MGRWTGTAVALASVLAAAPVAGATLDYSSLYVLGDSLSDTGNVYRATDGDSPPSPPYFQGRFSNGPVWADHVAEVFRDADRPTGNLAFGGAEVNFDSGGRTPDLRLQALVFGLVDDDDLGDRPLVALQGGANDFKDVEGRTHARAVGRATADTLGDIADSLRDDGIGDLLMFSMPDLGQVPNYARSDNPAQARWATAYTLAFNRRLDRRIGELRDDGADVRKVDVYAILNAVLADPESFGVRNTKTPCIDEAGNVCTPRQARRRAFFDRTHINAVLHRRLAEAVFAELGDPVAVSAAKAAPAPVPLPGGAGLLAGGLLVLGLVARRRGLAR